MTKHTFRIESPDGIHCDKFKATHTRAQQLARFYSLFVEGEFCIYVENPLWSFGNPLELGKWLRHGYTRRGVFFDA